VTDPAQIERLLVPYPSAEMEAYPVSRKVGKSRNNGPDLIEPIED
jgi:putative SOS response-associated peptidase YedK